MTEVERLRCEVKNLQDILRLRDKDAEDANNMIWMLVRSAPKHQIRVNDELLVNFIPGRRRLESWNDRDTKQRVFRAVEE